MALSSANSSDHLRPVSSSGDESVIEDVDDKPFLSRIVNDPIGNCNRQTRRRFAERQISGNPNYPSRQQYVRSYIGHAAKETYLVTRLSFTLLGYLG